MSEIRPRLSLAGLQKYVQAAATERGFDDETTPEKFMLLQEELGEAAKAVRKSSGIKTHENSKQRNLEDELADMLFLILDISNQFGLDLDAAFIAKERLNNQRKWDSK